MTNIIILIMILIIAAMVMTIPFLILYIVIKAAVKNGYVEGQLKIQKAQADYQAKQIAIELDKLQHPEKY